jgi:hypothetical protein
MATQRRWPAATDQAQVSPAARCEMSSRCSGARLVKYPLVQRRRRPVRRSIAVRRLRRAQVPARTGCRPANPCGGRWAYATRSSSTSDPGCRCLTFASAQESGRGATLGRYCWGGASSASFRFAREMETAGRGAPATPDVKVLRRATIGVARIAGSRASGRAATRLPGMIPPSPVLVVAQHSRTRMTVSVRAACREGLADARRRGHAARAGNMLVAKRKPTPSPANTCLPRRALLGCHG